MHPSRRSRRKRFLATTTHLQQLSLLTHLLCLTTKSLHRQMRCQFPWRPLLLAQLKNLDSLMKHLGSLIRPCKALHDLPFLTLLRRLPFLTPLLSNAPSECVLESTVRLIRVVRHLIHPIHPKRGERGAQRRTKMSAAKTSPTRMWRRQRDPAKKSWSTSLDMCLRNFRRSWIGSATERPRRPLIANTCCSAPIKCVICPFKRSLSEQCVFRKRPFSVTHSGRAC